MQFSKTEVVKLRVEDLEGLDPVECTLEDISPGEGRIIIRCWDKSWPSYWGAMGDRDICDFILTCDNDYVIKSISNVSEYINDLEKIGDAIGHELEVSDELQYHSHALSEQYGEDWWQNLPQKINSDYVYLDKVVSAVKEVIKWYKQ